MQDPMRLDRAAATGGEPHKSGMDLRAAPRVGVLIRPAKLVTPDRQFLCVIRDLSETGLSVRVFHELPDRDEYCIELQNGDRIMAQVMWQDEDRLGLRFAERADLDRLVSSPSRFAKRAIRIELDCEASLGFLGRELPARISDISGQGAKVICDEHLMLASNVTLKAAGLPETRAKVRWRRNGAYGLVFEDTLQMSELAQTVAAMQQASA